MSRAVETERQRLGGELTPEIIPLLSALEAKKLLIEGTGPANVFRVIHHEIKRPNRESQPAAMKSFSFSWAAYAIACCNSASNAGRRRS